jgi:hypothetical protein
MWSVVGKYFIDLNGAVTEYKGGEHSKDVRFPVCLVVNYFTGVRKECADFVLNISKCGIFIGTEDTLPIGSRIRMCFHIPPDVKLLGEFDGEVIKVNNSNDPRGMFIRFVDCSNRELDRLEGFLDENRHLLDKTV